MKKMPLEKTSSYDPNAHDRAFISLVLSILGLLLCGPFTSIPAIVLAVKARRDGNREAIGIIGLILGIIGAVIFAAAVLFFIFLCMIPDGVGVPIPDETSALVWR
ncbi:MAG: hypothetical protein IJW00_09285 [Clostridia bacterium]|nr:hypothetical protein [Clostridia bacterium]